MSFKAACEPHRDAGPVSSSERIIALDAVRGFALLGVLVANLVLFSISNNVSTDMQQEAMFADPLNRFVLFAVLWLVDDKASTLFAILFGAGFWLQLSRLRSRGSHAASLYLRRLLILFLFGVANLFLIWPWDILQQYALVGLVLLALRAISTRLALVLGVLLAIAGKPVVDWLFDQAGWRAAADAQVYSDHAIAQRQKAYLEGGYLDWLRETSLLVWNDYLLSGAILGWAAYVLGRFLIGMVLMRENAVERLVKDPRRLGAATIVLMTLGLALEAIRAAVLLGFLSAPEFIRVVCQAVGAPALAVAYAGLILMALRSDIGRLLFTPIMKVGQMALTNYLAQGLFVGLLLFSQGPGLALAGQLSPGSAALCATGFFALQVLLSHIWLANFQRGAVRSALALLDVPQV